MQVIVPTIDGLIQKNGVTGVTGVATSVSAGSCVTHNPDDRCNGSNKKPSKPSVATFVTSDKNSSVTLEPSVYRGVTPVTPVTPKKLKELHKETGYTRVKIDFSKLTSFIHSEQAEDETNSPNAVSDPIALAMAGPVIRTVTNMSDSTAHRHWAVQYPDRVMESVFCPPVSFAELMRLDNSAIAAEPIDGLNTKTGVMSCKGDDVLINSDMHGCDKCKNLSSMGVCSAATKLGAMPGYRPVLGRRLVHRCPEWKPP